MIDEDDDFQAVLDAALRATGEVEARAKEVLPPSPVADEGDEGEMTSVMGPEERRLLQHATRGGSDTAPSEVVREEESARPTARPPKSGNEPPVLVGSDPDAPNVSVASELAHEGGNESVGSVLPVVRQPDRRPRHFLLDWSVVAFFLLAAASAYAVQR